ncbi:MAG: NAD-dependent epimerase/dehydratase family protein [Silvibacterium sp.]
MTEKTWAFARDKTAAVRPKSSGVCLVTGVAGFIGSHLAGALLAKGHFVIGVDSLNDYYSPQSKQENLCALLASKAFIFHKKDLNDIPAGTFPAHIDYVFHLAGQPGVRSSWSTSFETYLISNILATQRLLELIVNCDVRRLIFASSSSIYGQASGPVTEGTIPRPLSPYGATKLAAEGLCLAYSSEYSLPLTILRYFTVYGPRQRPDMAIHKFLNAAITQTPIRIFGDGTQGRAFTYVDDVVDASVSAMSESCHTSIYNISGGRPSTLNDCLAIIEETTGRRITREFCETQRGDPYETEADISEARRCLGYEPRVSFESGIAREWEWMQLHLAGVVSL